MEQQNSIIAQHFFNFILNTNYDEEAAQEQWLCDFSDCALNDFMLDEIADQYDLVDKSKMLYSNTKSLYAKLRYKYWENHIKEKISLYYNIDLECFNISLQELFKTIAHSNDILQIKEELKSNCIKDFDMQHIYSSEEIQQLLKTTTSPTFYAKHTGITKEKAQKIIYNRENELCYKAYRPTLEYHC